MNTRDFIKHVKLKCDMIFKTIFMKKFPCNKDITKPLYPEVYK